MNFIKQIFVKYITSVLVVISLVGIALFVYSKWRDANEERRFSELIGTKTKYEQLSKYTAKLESDYRTQADLHVQAKKRFSEVVKKRDERIKLLSDATYLIGRHVSKQNGPDYYYETPRATRNYVLNELRIQGKDSPAVGYILIKNDGRTYKRNYKFEVRVETLSTQDEKTGHVKVYSKAYLVQQEKSPLAKRVSGYKDWKGIEYPLEITGGVALIDPTLPNMTRKFHWWAPHINGGFSASVGQSDAFLRPAVDLSISGYGRTKNDLDWKLFHLGLDSNTEMTDIGVHFLPFSYRFYSSLLSNTYIGPGVGLTKDGTNYQLNLNLTF